MRKWDKVGPMGIFTVLVFLFSLIWGCILYSFTGVAWFIVVGVFGSISLLSFSRGYVYYTLNDFSYF